LGIARLATGHWCKRLENSETWPVFRESNDAPEYSTYSQPKYANGQQKAGELNDGDEPHAYATCVEQVGDVREDEKKGPGNSKANGCLRGLPMQWSIDTRPGVEDGGKAENPYDGSDS